MTSREKFEQAIKARFGDLIDYRVCKNSDGEYMAWDMQVAWWAWQAAETDMAVQLANAESKCRELAAREVELPTFNIPVRWGPAMICADMAEIKKRCVDAILAAGIGVKGE